MKTFLAPDALDYEQRGFYRLATLKEGCPLADELRPLWPANAKLLFVAADPADDTTTENDAMDLASALTKAGLSVGQVLVLQGETADAAAPLVAGAQVIALGAGDKAKREAFFGEVGLPGLLAAAPDALVIALDEEALAAAGR